jgi:hypothetical protein
MEQFYLMLALVAGPSGRALIRQRLSRPFGLRDHGIRRAEQDDAIWDVTVFSRNRDRLLERDLARAFFAKVIEEAGRRGLLSDEYFTVDGTLIEANDSMKSFRK